MLAGFHKAMVAALTGDPTPEPYSPEVLPGLWSNGCWLDGRSGVCDVCEGALLFLCGTTVSCLLGGGGNYKKLQSLAIFAMFNAKIESFPH